MLKVLELFAGIGAASKALENLGIEHEIVDAVEIDKYAIKAFNTIHNTNFEPQDITKWDKDIGADLIIHGSPCQDYSIAGLQAAGVSNAQLYKQAGNSIVVDVLMAIFKELFKDGSQCS